ncbi:DUF6509 family protein [Sutcliffiella deserti]|uniref:DUF6509 family protein n=1 Tax=Sutcliffiella deserti TaxID=2875501 RepID=UPI001CC104BD|nr:DUF6509 family protein [Sutcliffiella deserti]
MNITRHEVDKINDPTGILVGERYEFILDIDLPEDDELYNENGVYLKVILAVDENSARIAQYYLFEGNTNTPMDFELEDEEIAAIKEYCTKQLASL